MDATRKLKARNLLDQGYREQVNGNVREALRCYRASLALCPSAEGHSFLAWGLSHRGRFEKAIAECKKAIALDPENGSPYNDIGAYLIHLGRHEEALPWLERALSLPRCEPRHYPHCNLGRVFLSQGQLLRALSEFDAALRLDPTYAFARETRDKVRLLLQ